MLLRGAALSPAAPLRQKPAPLVKEAHDADLLGLVQRVDRRALVGRERREARGGRVLGNVRGIVALRDRRAPGVEVPA